MARYAISVLAASLVAISGLIPTPARAADGCLVLLCLAAPSWRNIAQCVDPVRQVLRDLARGRPFPNCSMSGAGNSATHQWSSAPGYCPAQYTYVSEGGNGRVYSCGYAGAVSVDVQGSLWARVWWNPSGDSVTEYTPVAKGRLGSWETRFDDDYTLLILIDAGQRGRRWLYATGLRLSEMANAQRGDLREVDYRSPEGKMDTGWLLSVVGKGDKLREVPVPASLVEELQKELGHHGLEPDVQAESNQDISILVRFEDGHAESWSMSGLAKGIKALLTDIATDLEPDDAKQLRKASTHWLRHSHGSHSLNGRPGEAGVPIQVVQNNLGHASIGTTSGYLTTERDMRLAAMKGFGERVK